MKSRVSKDFSSGYRSFLADHRIPVVLTSNFTHPSGNLQYTQFEEKSPFEMNNGDMYTNSGDGAEKASRVRVEAASYLDVVPDVGNAFCVCH